MNGRIIRDHCSIMLLLKGKSCAEAKAKRNKIAIVHIKRMKNLNYMCLTCKEEIAKEENFTRS